MRWYVISLGLVFVLAACSSATEIPPTDTAVPQLIESDAAQLDPTMVPERSENSTTATSEAVEGDAAPPVEVREELAATDPTTVNLGTGTPTLVEFFAFW